MSQGGAAVELARSYISGRWTSGQQRIATRNPYTGEEVAHVCIPSGEAIDDAIRSAACAASEMARLPTSVRSELLERAATELARRRDELARFMVLQSGRPIKECQGEVGRAVTTLKLSAESAKWVGGETLALDAVPGGAGKFGFTVRVPVGVVAAICPFNSPLNLACHKIGPALAAGNVVVFKPPVEGALVSQALLQALLDSGLPENAIQLVNGGAAVGSQVVSHPLVRLVNFTGSGATAVRILADAGLKRTLFELGGTGATIVHDDANLGAAVKGVVPGAFGLAGQSCGSVQRLLVHESIADPLLSMLVEATTALVVGDPFAPETDVGPLISEDAAKRVELWVQEAIGRGARVLCGGKRMGALVEPTILVDVHPDDRVVCEEVFGPTLAVITYRDLTEAIAAVNDSPWGLQAGIYTRSMEVAMRAVREIEVGGLNVNGPSRGRTELQPYGGVKQSGWGREGPRYAFEEMTDLKMVAIAPE